MLMKLLLFSLLAIALALPSSGSAVPLTTADPAPQPTAAAPPERQLSGPARDVVKMLKSGVPEEVVKTFIQTSSSFFNLTPDDIVQLQALGISEVLTVTMLNHDKAQREKANLAGPPSPPATAQAPVVEGAPAASDAAIYSNLAPYGYWNDVPGYGWAWQPYGWLGYDYYPWAWLGFGYWWNCPGRGWCWFPHSHFRNFDHFRGNGLFFGHNHLTTAGFNRGLQSPTRSAGQTLAFRNSTGINRATTGLRSSSPWVSGRFSSGSGFRTAATAGFSSRGGGSFRSGVGGGGFRSGGGGGFHSGHR